jgi:hypothetical protein
MYTDDLTIEEAWSHLCDSLLNGAYSRSFNDLLTFIPRGTILEDGTTVCSDISSYTLRIVKDLFKLPDEFKIQDGNFAVGAPVPEQSERLRCLYMPTNYPYTLPWHVLQTLSTSSNNEGKKVMTHMWKSRMAPVRKRLGALESLPQLQ